MIKTNVILIITSPKLIAPTVMITMSRTSRPTLSPLPPPLLSSSSSSSSSSSLHYSTMYITITIIIIINVIIAIINTIIIIILTNWQQFPIEITSHCSKLRCGSWFHCKAFNIWKSFLWSIRAQTMENCCRLVFLTTVFDVRFRCRFLEIRTRQENCATFESFPWSVLLSNIALDQSALEKTLSYC